jgi:hypothetical protein
MGSRITVTNKAVTKKYEQKLRKVVDLDTSYGLETD